MTHVSKFLNFNIDSDEHCLTEAFLGYLSPKWRWIIAKLNYYHNMAIANLSICYELFVTQINLNNKATNNLASEYKYCFDTTLLSNYFYPNTDNIPENRKHWKTIVYQHTEFQWATSINMELMKALEKAGSPSKHIINLKFIHLNREMFKLPSPNKHKHKLSENKLHQLRLIIIRNHPNINTPKCPFCLKYHKDPDIHLILKCPKIKTHFLSFWSNSFFNLQQSANTLITDSETPSYLLNIIYKYLSTPKPSPLLQDQFLNIIFTADTYIDQNILKFNCKFNNFTALITATSATWIDLINKCITNKSLTPLASFHFVRLPEFKLLKLTKTPRKTHLIHLNIIDKKNSKFTIITTIFTKTNTIITKQILYGSDLIHTLLWALYRALKIQSNKKLTQEPTLIYTDNTLLISEIYFKLKLDSPQTLNITIEIKKLMRASKTIIMLTPSNFYNPYMQSIKHKYIKNIKTNKFLFHKDNELNCNLITITFKPKNKTIKDTPQIEHKNKTSIAE